MSFSALENCFYRLGSWKFNSVLQTFFLLLFEQKLYNTNISSKDSQWVGYKKTWKHFSFKQFAFMENIDRILIMVENIALKLANDCLHASSSSDFPLEAITEESFIVKLFWHPAVVSCPYVNTSFHADRKNKLSFCFCCYFLSFSNSATPNNVSVKKKDKLNHPGTVFFGL